LLRAAPADKRRAPCPRGAEPAVLSDQAKDWWRNFMANRRVR